MNGMVWVRVLVGAVWLNGAIEKLLNPGFPQQFATSLEAGGFVSQAPPFFQDFMRGVVVPNVELFAQLMRAGELALGIALILGLLTNLAAVGSVVTLVISAGPPSVLVPSVVGLSRADAAAASSSRSRSASCVAGSVPRWRATRARAPCWMRRARR